MQAAEKRARDIANALLRIKAVNLNPKQPFTWTSGMKSPIYCDNRLTISYPDIRGMIADGFAELIRERHPDAELIAGAATGGIPHAALVADRLELPMVYVRSKPKGHGQGRMIEGVLHEGQKTVVIEDLISTGGSSLKVAQAVDEAGGRTLAVAAIFTYEFASAVEAFRAANVELHTLTSFSALIREAAASGAIDSEDLDLLGRWRDNPNAYGQ